MYPIYVFVLFSILLLPGNLRAEEFCQCTISKVDDKINKSAGCDPTCKPKTIDIKDGVGEVELFEFVDLRGVTVILGDNAHPKFLAGAAISTGTYFKVDGTDVSLDVVAASGVLAKLKGPADILGLNDLFAQLDLVLCLGIDISIFDPLTDYHRPCTLGGRMVLPVDLLTYTATTGHDGVEVAWSTATEESASHYELYGGSDASSLSLLTTLQARGTRSERSDYRYLHRNPFDGDNYYRLDQVDYDGTVHSLGVRHVTWGAQDGTIQLYPNPVRPGETIYLRGATTPQESIHLINAAGTIVREISLQVGGQLVLPTGLESGLYLLYVDEDIVRLAVGEE